MSHINEQPLNAKTIHSPNGQSHNHINWPTIMQKSHLQMIFRFVCKTYRMFRFLLSLKHVSKVVQCTRVTVCVGGCVCLPYSSRIGSNVACNSVAGNNSMCDCVKMARKYCMHWNWHTQTHHNPRWFHCIFIMNMNSTVESNESASEGDRHIVPFV